MTFQPVRVETIEDGKRIRVTTPYSPEFVEICHNLKAKFTSYPDKAWVFDAKHAERVREICRELFGVDGSESNELSLVHFHLDRATGLDPEADRIHAFGRDLCWRRSSGGRVRLADGATVLAGGFPARGGNEAEGAPALKWKPGTVLEIEDVPAELLSREIARYGAAALETLDGDPLRLSLITEREHLLARLAEVNDQLGEG